MTIKQQGGVFGRNPTFNNVEVDGTATLDSIAASDKLRVTASDNPAAYIEFENTFQNTGVASQAGLLLGVNSSVQTNYAGVVAIENGNNTNGVLLGLYANNGSGPLLVAQARNNKNFEIVDGDLVVASGHGIDFSATAGTGTSELFDDYEEGTFTPEVEGASSAGTYTYATQSGVYTKVGDLVTVTINLMDITESVAGSGTLKISGLPFSASGTHVGSIWARSVNFDNAAAYLVPYVSLTNIYITEVVDNATGGSVNVADLTSGSARLYITLTYKV